ncbi:DUF930 domain-containing protein [Bosea sp. TND4EK4]|uniref:DUF930 domain-containing protein n=1 Tax=Bosea sp. TND4EK4 TaxID=1907408 RepID=UPI001FCD4BE3|nr:DUF930 domain-containing protein [Bosea sp. TND4EK4]
MESATVRTCPWSDFSLTMAAAIRARPSMPPPGLPIAAILHAALLAWLASVATRSFESVPIAEESVEVELRTQEEFEALIRPKPAPAVAPVPAAPTLPEAPPKPDASAPSPQPPVRPSQPAPVDADGMVHPPRMLSQRVLSDPRSRETVALLPRLAPGERVEQLCGLEAMGQIHEWQRDFEPDRVTAYALAGTKLSGRVLTAEGAAFRSKRRWYGLRFACTVSPDLTRITAFAFHVGEPIPQERWEALGLPAVH